MDFAVRQQSARKRAVPSDHRCPQCREQALMLQRRHVSPPRLGDQVVTEFYDCDCCEASYKYSPANDSWRTIATY